MDYTYGQHPDVIFVDLHRTIRRNISAICHLNSKLEEAITSGECCGELTHEAKETAFQTQALLRRYSNLVNHSTTAVERSERRLNQQELQTAFHAALKQLEGTAEQVVITTEGAFGDSHFDGRSIEDENSMDDQLISVQIRDDDLKKELMDDQVRHLMNVKSEIDEIKQLYHEMNNHVNDNQQELNRLENQVVQTSDYSHLANQQLTLAKDQAQMRIKRIVGIVGAGVGVLSATWYCIAS